MHRLQVFLAVSFLIPLFVAAGEIEFSRTEYDLGSIAGGYYQPAQFAFTNKTDAQTAILSVRSAPSVKLEYQRGYIKTGETSVISIKIETQTLGDFAETVQIYFAHTDKPYLLKITGKMVTAVECFPDKSNWEMREIRIIDKESKEIIHEAEAEFAFNFERNITIKKQTDGRLLAQLPIGRYGVKARAQYHASISEERYIRKTEPIIYIELSPTGEPQPQAIRTPAPQEQIRLLPPAPTDYGDSVLPASLYRHNNIVFLIDISLSMRRNGKMQNVQKAMHGLIDALRPTDSIGIVVYNNKATTLISQLSGADKDSLHATVDKLVPAGLTNGVSGLQMAYQIASESKNIDGNNQILLITDGEFTSAKQSETELGKIINGYAQQNIKMSILSFGEDKDAIAGLKRIAKKGDGNYLDFSNLHDENILIEEIKNQSFKQ